MLLTSLNVTNKNGDTPLHVAASSGNLAMVEYLVGKGGNLKAINNDSNTLLHLAAVKGDLDVVKFLIEKGANVHTRIIRSINENNNGKTALHLAAQNGRLDVVEYLIKKGADVSSRDDSGKTSRGLANQSSHTGVVKFLEEVQLNLSLLNAVKQGNFNKMEEYINQGASLKVKDRNGDTLQEIATRNGNIEIAEFLKQTELDLNLVDAVKQGNLDMAKEYISKGASLEAKDKDGHSLPYLAAQNYDIELFLIQAQLNLDLMNAVKQDNLDMVKYISKEAGLEIKDKNGNTILHLAAASGHLDTAKYLIEEGADFNAINKNNSTPLHAAASSGKLNIVKYLIEEKGVGLEVKDKDSNTPLSLAAQSSHLDVVKYLAEKGTSLSVTNESGNTPIHEAASLDIVKYLIEKGANFNAVNRNGFTLLHLAAFDGKLDVAKYLVEEKRANLEVKDDNGNAPSSLAALNGHLDVVKYLVGKGADTSALGSYLDAVKTIIDERSIDAQDRDGNTSLHLAASSGYLGIVKYLVEKGANLHVTNGNGRTPLHVSAEQGYLDIVKYFIGKGADLNATDNRDVNPLHLAAANGKLDVIKYLVEKGANIHTRMITNNDGKSALHLAVESDNLGVVEYLISNGADPNATDKYGNTSLHVAITGGLDIVKYLMEKGAGLMAINKGGHTPLHYAASLDIIKYIIERGSDIDSKFLNVARGIVNEEPTNERDYYRNTPLHKAASSGYLGIVKYLVESGANLNTANKFGETSLHKAAQEGCLDVVKYFIEKGVNLHANITGDYLYTGYTPLHFAAEKGKLNVVKYLTEKGADLNATNNNSQTPLHLAVVEGSLDTVKYLVDKGASLHPMSINGNTPLHLAALGGLDAMKYLVEEKGADVNVTNGDGNTPLHFATDINKLDVVKYLIEKGANINAANRSFRLAPLHVAAQRGGLGVFKFASETGYLNIVRYLVEKGADLNARGNIGNTPLHGAAKYGHLDIVEYLVEKGANLSATTRYGKTPLDYAIEYGTPDVVKYLESKGAHRSRRSIDNDNPAIEVNQATSGASRSSSWVNVFAYTAVDTIKGVFQFISSPFKPAIGIESSQPSKARIIQGIDTNGTLLLLDVFIRKITGQKYVSTADQPMPLLEARGYALSITTEFERVLKDTAKRSGVSVNKSIFNSFEVYKAIEGKMISGELSKITTILYSAIEEAYPKNEKFLSILKGNIEKMLDGQQVVNNVHSSNQMQNTIGTSDKMPLSSLNSIAIEPLNGKKGITCAGRVA